MLSLVDIGAGLWRFAGQEFPGEPDRRYFNDLEMMQLGNGDFVAEHGAAALARARAHMTMWAVMKSPLVLSTNLSALGADTLRVATNPLALRMIQGVEVEIWSEKKEVHFSVSCERARSGIARWMACAVVTVQITDVVDAAVGFGSGSGGGDGVCVILCTLAFGEFIEVECRTQTHLGSKHLTSGIL